MVRQEVREELQSESIVFWPGTTPDATTDEPAREQPRSWPVAATTKCHMSQSCPPVLEDKLTTVSQYYRRVIGVGLAYRDPESDVLLSYKA